MSSTPAAGFSSLKRLIGLLGLVAVILGSMGFGLWLSGGPRPAPPAASPLGVLPMLLLATLMLVLGGALYALVLISSGFTFRFDRPILPGYAQRRRIYNLFLGVFPAAAFANLCAPGLLPMLSRFLRDHLTLPAAFFLPFIVAQFLFVWLDLHAPVEAGLVHERLRALGLPPEVLRRGYRVGISDATKKKSGRAGMCEDDIGMLWLDPQRLVYRGDSQAFDIRPEQLLSIERRSHPREVGSYWGVLHILLRFTQDDGRELQYFLHAQGCWTLSGGGRFLDDLHEHLTSWQLSAANEARKPRTIPPPLPIS